MSALNSRELRKKVKIVKIERTLFLCERKKEIDVFGCFLKSFSPNEPMKNVEPRNYR